jgi:uncharacterized small protein (TIGR04563 family)
MASTDKQKQSLYFPEETLREIMREANRQDRSLSWVVQQAWRVAREQIKKFPSVDHHGPIERERPPDSEARSAEADRRMPSMEVLAFLRGKFDRELTG